MGKLSALTEALLAHGEDDFIWTFHEIEERMGQLLPIAAYKYGSIWSNSTQNSHSKHWRRAGYRASRAGCDEDEVRFIRVTDPKRNHALLNPRGAYNQWPRPGRA